MRKNIGFLDKILRVVIAVVIGGVFSLNLIQNELHSYMLLLGAVILIITSLLHFCPLYFILGIKTRKKKTEINED